jgi:hypothetical protein
MRLMRGAKPSDLPIEQSSKFELVIILRIAKALDDPKSNRALYCIRRIIEGQGDPGDEVVTKDSREAKYFEALAQALARKGDNGKRTH